MEASTPCPIDDVIAELADSDQPLLSSKLAELSNLSREALTHFQLVWETIDPVRQRQIVGRLVELAEDNLVLNFDDIFKYCLQDEDIEVQCQAIEGLWDSEETSLIGPLLKMLEEGDSEKVRAAAATALGKYTLLAEHDKLRVDHATVIQETLLKVVADNSRPAEVRRRALEAVSPLSIPQVRISIREAHESDNIMLKISAIYAMGKNCDPSWLPILLEELTNPDAEIRYEAAVACGELEDEDALPHLIELTDDPDSDVVMVAIQALGKIGGISAREYLEQCLDDTTEAVREMVEQTLSEMAVDENHLPFRLPVDRD